jgi:hypothetical protein
MRELPSMCRERSRGGAAPICAIRCDHGARVDVHQRLEVGRQVSVATRLLELSTSYPMAAADHAGGLEQIGIFSHEIDRAARQ